MDAVIKPDGLLHAWELDGTGGGRTLDWGAVDRSAAHAARWQWLHFDYSAPDVQEWMRTASGLSERAAVIHESLASRLAEMTNQRMYILSIVAAIFLPLSFVTGLLGINVGGIPGSENPHGFWEVNLVLLGVAAAIWAFFRWRRRF